MTLLHTLWNFTRSPVTCGPAAMSVVDAESDKVAKVATEMAAVITIMIVMGDGEFLVT